MKNYALWMSASVLALGWGGTAMADGASPPSASDPRTTTTQQPAKPGETTKADAKDKPVEKVVVTAERRKTSAQKTPISTVCGFSESACWSSPSLSHCLSESTRSSEAPRKISGSSSCLPGESDPTAEI